MPRMKGLMVMAAVGVVSGLLGGSARAGPMDHPGYVKSLTCTACHGAGGNSKSDSMPILSGMAPAYFTKQIEAYAGGKRPSPEMEPYAKMVRELGAEEIARYFAEQKMEPSPVSVSPDAVARGRASSGQCVICHGPEGRGDPARLIPNLAGQPPGYLLAQMLLFKQDRRNADDPALSAMKALMRTIADDTYGDLAAYYSSLR